MMFNKWIFYEFFENRLSRHGGSFNTDTDTVKKLFGILVNDSQTYSREAIAQGFCRGVRSDSTLTEMSVDLKARSRWASVDGKFVVV